MGKNNKKKKTKTVDENDPEALKVSKSFEPAIFSSVSYFRTKETRSK